MTKQERLKKLEKKYQSLINVKGGEVYRSIANNIGAEIDKLSDEIELDEYHLSKENPAQLD